MATHDDVDSVLDHLAERVGGEGEDALGVIAGAADEVAALRDDAQAAGVETAAAYAGGVEKALRVVANALRQAAGGGA